MIGLCLHNSQGGGMEQDYTQFEVLILCDDSTGCDEICDCFATEADTMIDIVCEVVSCAKRLQIMS